MTHLAGHPACRHWTECFERHNTHTWIYPGHLFVLADDWETSSHRVYARNVGRLALRYHAEAPHPEYFLASLSVPGRRVGSWESRKARESVSNTVSSWALEATLQGHWASMSKGLWIPKCSTLGHIARHGRQRTKPQNLTNGHCKALCLGVADV